MICVKSSDEDGCPTILTNSDSGISLNVMPQNLKRSCPSLGILLATTINSIKSLVFLLLHSSFYFILLHACGNSPFAGHTRLTKSAAYVTPDEFILPTLIFYSLGHAREEICKTFCLVMAFFADSSCGATLDTFAAGPLADEQAVFPVITCNTW